MNKKQVEEYIWESITLKIDMIQDNLNDYWQSDNKKHFEAFPKKLYKYVTINDNYLDSVRNNYIYLCPAKKLDDQFECRVDFPIEKILKNKSIVDGFFIRALVDKISDYPSGFDKKQMATIVRACLDNDNQLDLGKVSIKMNEIGSDISEEQKAELLKFYAAIMSGAWMSQKSEEQFLWLINKAQKARDEIGIGSLTENNKSQVMWEMYANHYQGICIEYDLYGDVDSMINTFPVIYGDKRKTKLLHILIGICLDSFAITMSKGKITEFDSAKDYIKLFLTKYNEWSFQKEWRIIGEAGMKFPVPQISKIYLGKRISDKDQNTIVDIAKEKGIDLYKQLDNFDSLELRYEKMALKHNDI